MQRAQLFNLSSISLDRKQQPAMRDYSFTHSDQMQLNINQ
jgi:hypothetical protein